MMNLGLNTSVGFGSTYTLKHRNLGYRSETHNINTTKIGTSISGTVRTAVGHYDAQRPTDTAVYDPGRPLVIDNEPIKYIPFYPDNTSYTIAAPGTKYDAAIEGAITKYESGAVGGGIIWAKRPYNPSEDFPPF